MKFRWFVLLLTPLMLSAGVKEDLSQSVKQLGAFRKSIAEEKISLSKRMTEINAALLEKRRQVRLLRMGVAERRAHIEELERKTTAADKEWAYQQGQLKSFCTKWHVSALPSEESNSIDSTERLATLEWAVSNAEKRIGGRVLQAEVVGADDAVVQGKLVQCGALLWFCDAQKKSAGSARYERGSGIVRLVADADVQKIQSLIDGQEVVSEIDLSDGRARALAAVQGSPWQMLRKGGFWVLPILFLALVSIVCSIFKWIQLSKIKSPPSGWMHRLLEAVRGAKQEEIQRACEAQHPVAEVLGDALQSVEYGAEIVEEIVYEKLIDVRSKMRAWLVFIGTTASIAPLLGLLGTVSGMITTFNVISVVGTGDAKPMAGGISEALVTTLFGLIVAIPSLILFALLSRKSKGIVQMTEKLSLTVINDIRKRSR